MATDRSFHRKTRRFELRLSDEELKDFLALEKSLGISRADIVRIRVLKNSAKMLVNTKELMKQLDLIGTELGRSGNNINQLARHANTLHKQGQVTQGVVSDFIIVFTEYIKIQQELEKLIRQLIRLLKG
jgi:cation transport regulator ChaC